MTTIKIWEVTVLISSGVSFSPLPPMVLRRLMPKRVTAMMIRVRTRSASRSLRRAVSRMGRRGVVQNGPGRGRLF